MISRRKLLAILNYNPETGLFTWKVSPNRRIRVGAIAGTVSDTGYIKIKLGRRLYRAHRLAIFYVTGRWPRDQVDHLNGNRIDNRWSNLRDATAEVNAQNLRHPRCHNSTGWLGVIPNRRSGRFISEITVRGIRCHLGTYPDPEPAHIVYLLAKRELHEGNTL